MTPLDCSLRCTVILSLWLRKVVKKKKTLGSKKRKQNQATQCHGGNLAGVGMFGWKLFQDVYD